MIPQSDLTPWLLTLQKGQTLLHYAIENENLEAVRLLVSSGASCTQFNKANHTSLHVAARKGLVNIYFSLNKPSVTQVIFL